MCLKRRDKWTYCRVIWQPLETDAVFDMIKTDLLCNGSTTAKYPTETLEQVGNGLLQGIFSEMFTNQLQRSIIRDTLKA